MKMRYSKTQALKHLSSNLRQGSSKASVTNSVLEFLNIPQSVTQSSFEDILLLALVIPRQKYRSDSDRRICLQFRDFRTVSLVFLFIYM